MRLLEKLSKVKWKYIHKRYRTLFFMHLIWDSFSKPYNKNIPFPYEIDCLYIDKELTFPEEQWEKLGKRILKEMEDDPEILLKLLQDSYYLYEDIERLIEEINSNLNRKNLLPQIKKYKKLMLEYGSYALLPLFVEREMEEKLKKKIE